MHMIFMKRLILSFIYFSVSIFFINSSIFDNIEWNLDKSKKNVSLFTQKDKSLLVFYYRAETISKDISTDILMKNVLSFDKYNKIFGRTKFFKVIKSFDTNNFIASAEIDFFPYKNRTYTVVFNLFKKIDENNKAEYSIEWYPFEKSLDSNSLIDDYNNKEHKTIKITNIYGRWTFKELNDNKTYISLEYHNDWQTNLPPKILHEFEKHVTIKNLASFINYCKKNPAHGIIKNNIF